jgi:hypothetical protein
MKKLFLILFLLPLLLNATTYYVATPAGGGNNSNNGLNTGTPFATWEKLSDVMVAGDIAYIRGGVYTSTQGAGASTHCLIQNLHGTSLNYITIQNYQNESPVFDLTSVGIPTATDPTAVYIQSCSYLHIKGLRVTGLQQNHGGSGISRGFDASDSPNCIFELIEVDHIGGGGFHLYNSNDVTYLNCDAHHNDDRWSNPGAWGGADGFSGTGGETSTRTTYEGCRSWWNSDDGWDFFSTDGIRTIKNCWSFWNGYQPGTFTTGGNGEGFKLGPTQTNKATTILKFMNNCLAFENRANGFSQNNAQCKFQIYNCTSYKNGRDGFWMGFYSGITQDFKNNISYDNPNAEMDDVGESQGSYNTWNAGTGVTVTDADFVSVSSTGVDGARQSNGDLPVLTFLHLVEGSDLRNAGTELGYGTDLGAFPYEAPATQGGTFRIRKKIIFNSN